VDYQTLTPFKALDVLKIAEIYQLEGLHQFLVKYVQSSINDNNIFKLLQQCDNSGVEKGKQICLEYAITHEDLFTSGDARVEVLGFKLYQEVTTALLKAKKAEKSEVKLAFEDPIIENFKTIYESESKDTTFSLQGQEIKVHKAILLNQSPELTEFIIENEKKNTSIYTLDPKYNYITGEAFNCLFKYFYYSEHRMDILYACQLYFFSRDMKLEKFCGVIETALGQKEFQIQSILPILNIAFSPLLSTNPELQKQLQTNGLRFAIENIAKIDFAALIVMSPLIGMHILKLLQQGLSENWNQIYQTTTPRERTIVRGPSWTFSAPEKNSKPLDVSEDYSENPEKSESGRKRTLERKKNSKSAASSSHEKKTPRKITKT